VKHRQQYGGDEHSDHPRRELDRDPLPEREPPFLWRLGLVVERRFDGQLDPRDFADDNTFTMNHRPVLMMSMR
jgi:hypothetical protein